MSSAIVNRILILGAGELGTALATAILAHPSLDPITTSLTISIRPSTYSSLTSSHLTTTNTSLLSLLSKGVHFIPCDLVTSTTEHLTTLFSTYTTVIHAGAMTQPAGTQEKITTAVLAASVQLYIPWQWGLDYDKTGPVAGNGLFAEQCDIRSMLRAQEDTKWFIVSCGVFLSFLFEEVWGVVETRDDGDGRRKVDKVRALGGWDNAVVVTSAKDIARAAAELLLVDVGVRDRAVFVAGECVTYGEVAGVVEKVVGRKVEREVWKREFCEEMAEREGDGKVWRYRSVFAGSEGLSWDVEGTYNQKKGWKVDGVEEYVRALSFV